MSSKLSLRYSEKRRIKLTKLQQKQIQKLYENAAADIAKELTTIPNTTSNLLRQQYLYGIQRQIDGALRDIRNDLGETIQDNMKDVSEAVVKDNVNFLRRVGMPIEGAFSHVPDRIVKIVATGQLYEGGWTLSKALWRSTRKTQQDVRVVIAQGIAQNKSAYEIAKDLEKYVNPTAKSRLQCSAACPHYGVPRLSAKFCRNNQKEPVCNKVSMGIFK